MKKVSMQDIADVANVARSTVSFVLNGKEKEYRIGDEVARRMRAVAKEMKYQFNEVARSLRTDDSLMHMQERKRSYSETLKKVKICDSGLICEVEYKDHEEDI